MNNGNLQHFDILFPPGFVNFVSHEETQNIPSTAYPEVQAYGAEAVHPGFECIYRTAGGNGGGSYQESGPPDPGYPDTGIGKRGPSLPVFYIPDDRDTAGRCVYQIY